MRLTIILLFWLLPFIGQAQGTYGLKRWHVEPGNYSGITHVGGQRYAVVSDKVGPRAGFFLWNIRMDDEGRLTDVESEGFRSVPWASDRDAEGIAYCPQWQTVFVSGEADQRVLEHRMDGTLTGRQLQIPAQMGPSCIQPNRGFEALCYDAVHHRFWTVTESPLRTDEAGLLRMLSFSDDLAPVAEYCYHLEPPQAKSPGRDHYHGIVSLAPLADGTLLVLEREARIAPRYVGSRCWCRLFRYSPADGGKLLLMEWSTRFTLTNTRFANYEGMCLGPQLPDGRQTLLLVCDSQGGHGRALWHLRDRLKVLILPPLAPMQAP